MSGKSFVARLTDSRMWALCGLATAFTGLALGSMGAIWPPLDIFSHFNGHLAGLAVSAAVALMIKRHGFLLLTAGLTTTLLIHSAVALQSRTSGEGASSAAGRAPLKVVSLNVWKHNRDIARLASFLRREDADIVLLYEVVPRMLELLKRLKDLYPHQLECARRKGCYMALLSKRPWRRAAIRPKTYSRPRMVWAEFGRGEAATAVIGVHLSKPTNRPWRQLREIEAVSTFVRSFGSRVILGGDFNATPWSRAYRTLVKRSGLKGAVGNRPSWPVEVAPFPQLAIDHLFVSEAVSATSVRLGPRVGSDHLPVVGVFALN